MRRWPRLTGMTYQCIGDPAAVDVDALRTPSRPHLILRPSLFINAIAPNHVYSPQKNHAVDAMTGQLIIGCDLVSTRQSRVSLMLAAGLTTRSTIDKRVLMEM